MFVFYIDADKSYRLALFIQIFIHKLLLNIKCIYKSTVQSSWQVHIYYGFGENLKP